jgi:hypothetical protein
VVRANRVDLASSADGGVLAIGRGSVVEGNTLAAELPAGDARWPVGICCAGSDAGAAAADGSRVAGNVLSGPQLAVYVSRCASVDVAGNRIDGGGRGFCGVALEEAADARVAENDVRGTAVGILGAAAPRPRVASNRVEGGTVGLLLGARDVEVTGNQVLGAELAGGLVGFVGTATVTGNRLERCGFAAAGGGGLSILAGDALTAAASSAVVSGNEVVDTGLAPDGKTATKGRAVGLLGMVASCTISGNRIGYSVEPEALDETKEHRALELLGPIDRKSGKQEISTGVAIVTGNRLRSRGGAHVVELAGDFQRVPNDPAGAEVATRFERVAFSDNGCEHVAPSAAKGAAVRLWGRYITVTGNHVRPRGAAAISVVADASSLAANL